MARAFPGFSRPSRASWLPLLACLCVTGLPAARAVAEMIGGNPGPQFNYVCPNSDDKPALDCYFDAVTHLYTMCKHVKSIEIIEFGYEQSMEGTNGAKSDSCLVKQKLNMTRPYQAALKQAKVSRQAVEGLRGLNELWLKSMGELNWKKGESDDDYKTRTMQPYEAFAEQIVSIQTVMQIAALPADQKSSAPVMPAAKVNPKSRRAAAARTATAAKVVPAAPAAPATPATTTAPAGKVAN